MSSSKFITVLLPQAHAFLTALMNLYAIEWESKALFPNEARSFVTPSGNKIKHRRHNEQRRGVFHFHFVLAEELL